ncbi:MAG: PEP-CTERM sorting domain-containing protein [Chthonomonadaceae bacterium]|nr:PEP-CTERM sorting domain-containing protein [Chthonomonadaceae bacterium]
MRWQEPCGSTYVVAPSAFLGDWSSLIGAGTYSYDFRMIEVPTDGSPLPFEVRVSGPGGSLLWTAPQSGQPTDWIHHSIQIDEASWTVTSGSFAATLADVSEVRMRVRLFDNTTPGIKIGFDNVVHTPVPEPTTLIALGIGGLALMRRKRAG